MTMKDDITVALTGNPNTGKSTIFNELTGARQKIGNWPGVTVDKKVGYIERDGRTIAVVDLPGTYSVNARSPEEKIVIDYLLDEKPDLVVNVVDSSNLERNLYLTIQLLERGIPLMIDLNMHDEAERHGIRVDAAKLETLLGMPVVETVGRSSQSIRTLLSVFTSARMEKYRPSEAIREHTGRIDEIMKRGYPASRTEELVIAERYSFIDHIVKETVTRADIGETMSEKIDSVLANGWTAIPVFFALLYGVFQITFEWIGQPISDCLDEFISGPLSDSAAEMLESSGASEWMQSLIVDGIIGGVGGVLTFVPLIFALFFCLSFLDGTGYMARVAFIVDPVMRRVGLTGKGVMPLMMGFGCAVPAIMGARALDSEKDRLTSILITPFLTCGAKLPIMALFAAMFFPEHAADVIFSMYVLGIVVAVIAAKVLGGTLFRDSGSTFLLELPPYRMPDMKTVLLETWDKGRGYLIKAGTIIFAMSVLIWFLSKFSFGGMVDDMQESFLASMGSAMATLFTLHGFGGWEAGAAVVTGILAKESVVSTMGILYGVGEVSAEAADAAETAATLMQSGMTAVFTPLSALSFMVFSELYTPCVTSLGTIKKETGSWRWMGFAAFYMFAVAWVVSLFVYQIGRLMGF